jgi:Icc protein
MNSAESAPAPRPYRIVQLTDCHLPSRRGMQVQGLDTEASFRAVVDQVLQESEPYDLALLTGDLAEEPAESAYLWLASELRRLSIPCLCLPGNHDDPETMRRILIGDAVTMDTSARLGNWQVICLDSTVRGESGGFLRDDQMALLDASIGTDTPLNRLIAVHHHPVPCGSPWMDRMMISNPERLLERVTARDTKTRAVIFGHIHQALDRTEAGVRFLGSPATSRQFEPLSLEFRQADLPPGYRWLELHASGELRTGVSYLRRPAR